MPICPSTAPRTRPRPTGTETPGGAKAPGRPVMPPPRGPGGTCVRTPAQAARGGGTPAAPEVAQCLDRPFAVHGAQGVECLGGGADRLVEAALLEMGGRQHRAADGLAPAPVGVGAQRLVRRALRLRGEPEITETQRGLGLEIVVVEVAHPDGFLRGSFAGIPLALRHAQGLGGLARAALGGVSARRHGVQAHQTERAARVLRRGDTGPGQGHPSSGRPRLVARWESPARIWPPSTRSRPSAHSRSAWVM